jgi:ubiquitin-protein ligase
MSGGALGARRIEKELKVVQARTFPDDVPFFAFQLPDPKEWRVLLVGPVDTPYSRGFFVFRVVFGSNYPFAPPAVTILSTDGGKVRFNPNLYSCGKVCLSLLGTYGNDWSAAVSAEKIIEAIRGLVMTSKPYHNEPGYEGATGPCVERYTRKITHEVLRVAVVQAVESIVLKKSDGALYEPFRSEVLSLFRLWLPLYRAACLQEMRVTREGDVFTSEDFESRAETVGKFDYAKILSRLRHLEETISRSDAEQRLKTSPKAVSYGELEASTGSQPQHSLWHVTFSESALTPDFCSFAVTVEVLYADGNRRPVVRLLSPKQLFHPFIAENGVIYFFASENRHPLDTRHGIRQVARDVRDTLMSPAEGSCSSWANAEAGRLLTSAQEADKIEYQTRWRRGLGVLAHASTLPAKRSREVIDVDKGD